MKIYAPNKQANGVWCSVRFVEGVGETDNPHLIKWFKEHGYKVPIGAAIEPKVEQKVEQKGLTLVPFKAYLKDNLLKVEIGLCKGKKLYNKKDDKKEQDIKRETARILNM